MLLGEDQGDLSIYEYWDKASKDTQALFHELAKLAKSLGKVRRDAFESVINFKCMTSPDATDPVVAYVHIRVRDGHLHVHIHEKHLSEIPLEDGFTNPIEKGRYRKIVIRDREHIRRAEPLLRAAYDDLHQHGHRRWPLP